MRRRKILWQLMPVYLLITLAALIVVTVFAFGTIRKFYEQQIQSDLENQGYLLEGAVLALLDPLDREGLNNLCREIGKRGHTRITVIKPSGEVIGDSNENPAMMDNHQDRPEVQQALKGELGHFTRFSHTLNQNMTYVAMPLVRNGEIIGVLRSAISVSAVEHTLRNVLIQILVGGGVVALFATVFSYLFSRRISRSLEQMTSAAKQFAYGKLHTRVPVPSSEELAQLAEAMNAMAVQLDEKISTIERQRKEEEAMLSSMIEGVLAIDTNQNIMNLNRAAAKLMGVKVEAARNRSVQEVVRNVDLQQFINRMLESEKSIESDIIVHAEADRFLQAHGTRLRESGGGIIGGLVVLHDVTQIRKLENIRRDFVTNVSHELKTPITTIRGFVETLLDGALDDRPDAEKFLNIIAKNADRLTTIIEDIFSLSQLEQDNERGNIHLSTGRVKGVLERAIEVCRPKADQKRIEIELECESHHSACFNPPLLEQAVINLIDNAVKYSPEDATVMVRVEQDDASNELGVKVIDQGGGIAEEHLHRLFERFYRVDKARSRAMGGTGLGLSIVKHIAQAHKGRVEVESESGQGSTFSIVLPQTVEKPVK